MVWAALAALCQNIQVVGAGEAMNVPAAVSAPLIDEAKPARVTHSTGGISKGTPTPAAAAPTTAKSEQSDATRPFISSLFERNILEDGADLCNEGRCTRWHGYEGLAGG